MGSKIDQKVRCVGGLSILYLQTDVLPSSRGLRHPGFFFDRSVDITVLT